MIQDFPALNNFIKLDLRIFFGMYCWFPLFFFLARIIYSSMNWWPSCSIFVQLLRAVLTTGSTFYNIVEFCLLLYHHLHEIVFLLIHTFSDTLHREWNSKFVRSIDVITRERNNWHRHLYINELVMLLQSYV